MKQIAGRPRITLIDYPLHVSAIVFFCGCSMRCPFCHNKAILYEEGDVSVKEAVLMLEGMKKLIDSVVISGGEPTISEESFILAREIKERGFNVKLDTNGTSPEMLRKMTEEGVVDYIAMDIKSDMDHYYKLAGIRCNMDSIMASRELITASGIQHEFRTTIIPGVIDPDMILRIYEEFGLKSAQKYCLQRYTPVSGYVKREHSKEEWSALTDRFSGFSNIVSRRY